MELNPFELKAEINKILTKLQDIKDFQNYELHYKLLDQQDDKQIIVKLLFKEIITCENLELIKFLITRYCSKDELIEKLWNIIKNNLSPSKVKIFALDLLRDIDSNWTYDECGQYIDNIDEIVEEDTKKIINNAIINPEVQIDFLDFLSSLPENDKIMLLNSLANDYSNDELANMLIPVFLSMQNTQVGKKALDILGNSKSQLAYHALNSALNFVDESLVPLIKKNISILKLAGIREDNTIKFYKEILKVSKPYKFCITYPDGHGNQAIIFSRINGNEKIQFVALVIDDYKGIRDCFGFNEISKFECNAIIEKFYKGQRAIDIEPSFLKAILNNAEKITKSMPYEYACWRNLLSDIEIAKLDFKPINTKRLNTKDFELILKYDFTDYWFLDENYSDEFEEFLKLANTTNSQDFDKIIDENISKVFYDFENEIWSKRILYTANLKYISGDIKSFENLYALYFDENFKKEFFKNIIKKSLYEYYFTKNDKKRIKEIEEMWVKCTK